jgi:hypothetical protein
MLTEQEFLDATKPVVFVVRNEDGSIRSHGSTRPDEPHEALYADDPEYVAHLARPRVPPSIANWKAHAILDIDGKMQAVLDLIAAIADATERRMVQQAFDRLDPIPRNSTKLVQLLTHPSIGYDEPGIDDLFIRGNALQIDP